MSPINLIAASDGTGNASLSTVQSVRSAGATAIVVDTTAGFPTNFMASMGTPHTFTDPVTSETITVISEATAVDFIGSVSSSTGLTITSISPGYTDAGSAVGDVIVVRPTTDWANNLQGVIKSLYPVGSIYSSTASTNPGTLFGFGTWVAFGAGRVLVGVGTSDEAFTAGATGGESNHVLSIGELAVHSHGVSDPGHTHGETVSSTTTGGTFGINGASGYNGAYGSDLSTETGYTGISTQNAGSGAGHNNLQPYIVVYIWNRTA